MESRVGSTASQTEPTFHDGGCPPGAELDSRPDPVAEFGRAVRGGRNWYEAALSAAGCWPAAAERWRRRTMHYLIMGEALDLFAVVERLAGEEPGLVAKDELKRFIFKGVPPLAVGDVEFARLLGPARYKAYLNYFYGVTVEEALLAAVEAEAHKKHALDAGAQVEPHLLLYGQPLVDLMVEFRHDFKGRIDSLDLRAYRSFTYWLFGRRTKTQVPARVASDTKKGLDLLRRLRGYPAEMLPDPLRVGPPPAASGS